MCWAPAGSCAFCSVLRYFLAQQLPGRFDQEQAFPDWADRQGEGQPGRVPAGELRTWPQVPGSPDQQAWESWSSPTASDPKISTIFNHTVLVNNHKWSSNPSGSVLRLGTCLWALLLKASQDLNNGASSPSASTMVQRLTITSLNIPGCPELGAAGGEPVA